MTPTSISLSGNANDYLVASNGCVGVRIVRNSPVVVRVRRN